MFLVAQDVNDGDEVVFLTTIRVRVADRVGVLHLIWVLVDPGFETSIITEVAHGYAYYGGRRRLRGGTAKRSRKGQGYTRDVIAKRRSRHLRVRTDTAADHCVYGRDEFGRVRLATSTRTSPIQSSSPLEKSMSCWARACTLPSLVPKYAEVTPTNRGTTDQPRMACIGFFGITQAPRHRVGITMLNRQASDIACLTILGAG